MLNNILFSMLIVTSVFGMESAELDVEGKKIITKTSYQINWDEPGSNPTLRVRFFVNDSGLCSSRPPRLHYYHATVDRPDSRCRCGGQIDGVFRAETGLWEFRYELRGNEVYLEFYVNLYGVLLSDDLSPASMESHKLKQVIPTVWRKIRHLVFGLTDSESNLYLSNVPQEIVGIISSIYTSITKNAL